MRRGLIIGRNFAFQNGLGLTIKTAKNTRKTPQTACTISPCAYFREGLLSEGFVHLRFGGLFSGGLTFYLFIYLFINLCTYLFIMGGGGIIGIFRYIINL